MSEFEQVWSSIAGVQGWMTRGQGEALYAAGRRCRPGARIVEIGSFQGRSTIVLASAAPAGAVVLAIDPHAGNDRGPQEIEGYAADADADHRAFLANLAAAGVSDRVTHLRMFSDVALGTLDSLGEAPIDVVYVDGAHRYRPALADIRGWGAELADGGTLLIHDSFSSIGVTAAIMRSLLWNQRFTYAGRSRSLAIYRATDRGATPANAARQLAQLPWFVKNVALKLALTAGLGRLARAVGRGEPEWPY